MINERLTKAMRCKHIHFIGIGGAGMSGIAELLLCYGYKVTGSDVQNSAVTERLVAAGAQIYYGHRAENVEGAEVVVYSTAIAADNPELVVARERGLAIVQRAQMLAEIMRFNAGIAVAGTHGKTTTTSILSHILVDNNLDPAYVIGGILNSSRRSACPGRGAFFVVEADESDGSFLRFSPVISIVTNIDRDHLEHYHMQMDELKKTFLRFINQLPFYGLAVLCSDDANIRELRLQVDRHVITYGFETGAEVRLSGFEQHGFSSSFQINWPKYNLENFVIKTNLTGRHNALNAVAALVVAVEGCGLSAEAVAQSLAGFDGVGRRMEQHGELTLPVVQREADDGDQQCVNGAGKIRLIEDYGHHPSELKATVTALKEACPNNRLVMLFQPHRYSRTCDLWSEFVDVLKEVDFLVLLDIYPASEAPIEGVTSERLAQDVREAGAGGKIVPVHCVTDATSAAKTVLPLLQDGDVVLVQGAGNVNRAVRALIDMCGSND